MRRACVIGLLACAVGCGTTVDFPGGEGGGGSDQGGATTSGPGSGGATQTGVGGSGPATTGAGGAPSTTTGAGGASSGSTVGVGGSSSSGGGGFPTTTTGVGGGSPICKTCGDALFGSSEPFCQGSEALFTSVVQCACVTSCPMECQSDCNSQGGSSQCSDCMFDNCQAEIDACFNDF